MTNKSQRFGKGFEYEIRDILREATGSTKFERVPSSGAWLGGDNRWRANLARKDMVEIMSGDIICPENWRWIVECKNHEDIPYHQLFLGKGCPIVDGFLQQVYQDAKTSEKEPLLIMKLRRKGWKLPKKVRDTLTDANIKQPQSKSNTIGIVVAELADHCDITGVNHIMYTGPLDENTCATWYFFDLENWLEYVVERTK